MVEEQEDEEEHGRVGSQLSANKVSNENINIIYIEHGDSGVADSGVADVMDKHYKTWDDVLTKLKFLTKVEQEIWQLFMNVLGHFRNAKPELWNQIMDIHDNDQRLNKK